MTKKRIKIIQAFIILLQTNWILLICKTNKNKAINNINKIVNILIIISISIKSDKINIKIYIKDIQINKNNIFNSLILLSKRIEQNFYIIKLEVIVTSLKYILYQIY